MLAELLDAELTNREAAIIFCWSRMLVVDEFKHRTKFTNMTFEDFLEALVRMATMMSFPTQIEIDAVHATNAGEFLIALQADAPGVLHALGEELALLLAEEGRGRALGPREGGAPAAGLVEKTPVSSSPPALGLLADSST